MFRQLNRRIKRVNNLADQINQKITDNKHKKMLAQERMQAKIDSFDEFRNKTP